jgi:hypothetical protein
LSHAVALAFGVGLALMAMLAVLPDPGLGPSSDAIGELQPSLAAAAGVLGANLVAVALLGAGGLAIGLTALSREEPRPPARMLVYLLLLAAAGWAYFVTGVDALAAREGVPRVSLLGDLVHGYLELPALLLPWSAVVFAFTADRRLDWRLVAAATACAAALLVPAALVEAYVVPGLLPS